MVKIGLFGAGHLGKIHLSNLLKLKGCEVVGFYDPNPTLSEAVAAEYNCKAYARPEELIQACDALDIVTPTPTHFDIAKACITQGKHIFIEKPITHTIEQAEQLLKMIEEANVKCQIGHVERFNPAYLAIQPLLKSPLFIEVHRLAQFNPRGTDVSVILDLMIHDIDIILSLVNSEPKRISASGVKVISDNADIANVRLEFDNGCIANITSSRISMKKMRKMRIFQKDAYISIDFLNKTNEIVRIKNADEPAHILDIDIPTVDGASKTIGIESIPAENLNSIQYELQLFVNSILHNTATAVSANDGYHALKVAHDILRKINNLIEE
jgi:predicted dehydrogenase